MSVVLLIMTDGRMDCIRKTIESANEHLYGDITTKVIHDDSGDPSYRAWLLGRYPNFEVIGNPAGRSGFGGAIQNAWRWIDKFTTEPYVFHLEDDFTFNEHIYLEDLEEMLSVIGWDDGERLAQVALLRQPWNATERAAGGVINTHPTDYSPWHMVWRDRSLHAVVHNRFFTTNPSLYRRTLLELGWPDGAESEGKFTQRCRDAGYQFAYFGRATDPPRVHHIGAERIGSGY